MEVSTNGPTSQGDAAERAKGGRSKRRRNVSVSERLFNSLAKTGGRQNMEGEFVQASIAVGATYQTYVNGMSAKFVYPCI